MATNARPGPIDANLEAMSKTLNQRLQEAQAKGDTKEIERLTRAAGTRAGLIGLVTGIPDLAILGYNELTDSNVKDLRTRILESTGVPTKAPTPELQSTYDAPEYAMLAWGLGTLIRQGYKGLKNIQDDKKMMSFKNELPPTAANKFQRFMMNGQGADDPMIMAALQQMRRDPRYSELFTTLDKAATKEAIKTMAPRPSRLTPQTATDKAVKSVQDQILKVKERRNAAGAADFTKAEALAGDRGLVNPSNTIQSLGELRSRYAAVGSPAALKTVAAIDELSPLFVDAATGMPKNMSAAQFKGLLSEFGQKVGSEDAVLKGLSQTDLEKLNKTVFASLSNDLTTSLKTVADPKDRQAIGALIKARQAYAAGSAEYNKLIAQGIPKVLQSKSIDEIDPEMLYGEYKKLNPGQRDLFRDWVGSSAKESLQFLDKTTYDTFLAKSFKKLPDGTMGYDLGKMAKNWQTLQKSSPDEADMLVKALGTNAGEFGKRMQDALVFSRKMDVGGIVPDAPQGGFIAGLKKTLPGLIGSTSGYQPAKATDLALETGKQILADKGLTSEQIMKVLLTDEGAAFLKSAALSPRSQKTLESLEMLGKATVADKTKTFLAAPMVGSEYLRSEQEAEGRDLVIPEDIVMPEEGMDDDLIIPDDLVQGVEAPTQEDVTPQPSFPSPQTGPVGEYMQNPQDEEAKVMQVIQSMKAQDPNLNEDYILNAYRQGRPEQKQQFLRLYQDSSFNAQQ
jgi:hypothetical protein